MAEMSGIVGLVVGLIIAIILSIIFFTITLFVVKVAGDIVFGSVPSDMAILAAAIVTLGSMLGGSAMGRRSAVG